MPNSLLIGMHPGDNNGENPKRGVIVVLAVHYGVLAAYAGEASKALMSRSRLV
jgi:hypothetical protein